MKIQMEWKLLAPKGGGGGGDARRLKAATPQMKNEIIWKIMDPKLKGDGEGGPDPYSWNFWF